MDPWAEQWERVGRWFSRFSETNAGRIDRNPNYHEDEAYAFFQNCHHLKDWLKHDPTSAGLVGDVEDFISRSPNLSLCADLCNGSKHLRLTSPRASPDTRIGDQHVYIAVHDQAGQGTPGSPTATFRATYQIEAAGKTYDAFTIAQGCMKEWQAYLQEKGLH